MTAPLRHCLLLASTTLLATTGCASLSGVRPEDRAVVVRLEAPRSTAVRRAEAAFREQGYEVKETLTSGTSMETEPFRHGDVEVVFRAEISGTSERSQVSLTGTYRRRELGGLVLGKEQEIRRASEGVEGELWARLTNLGLAIRTP
jgi:hypothetical protein